MGMNRGAGGRVWGEGRAKGHNAVWHVGANAIGVRGGRGAAGRLDMDGVVWCKEKAGRADVWDETRNMGREQAKPRGKVKMGEETGNIMRQMGRLPRTHDLPATNASGQRVGGMRGMWHAVHDP